MTKKETKEKKRKLPTVTLETLVKKGELQPHENLDVKGEKDKKKEE